MARPCCSYVFAVFLILFAGCTGESVRVVLPDRHPANSSTAEAPFVPPPDPFAGVSLPAVPSRPEKPHEHRHELPPGQMDEQMQMDDDRGSEMKHGSHGGTGAGEEEGR